MDQISKNSHGLKKNYGRCQIVVWEGLASFTSIPPFVFELSRIIGRGALNVPPPGQAQVKRRYATTRQESVPPGHPANFGWTGSDEKSNYKTFKSRRGPPVSLFHAEKPVPYHYMTEEIIFQFLRKKVIWHLWQQFAKKTAKFASFNGPLSPKILRFLFQNNCRIRDYQSMEWTGSICSIHNPVQSWRIWIGLDQ